MIHHPSSTVGSGQPTLAAVAALACLCFGTASGWSISGTVKSSTGEALVGVAVTVADEPTVKTTSTEGGAFSLSNTVGVQPRDLSRSSSVRIEGGDLLVQGMADGNLDLAMVNVSGRSVWSATAVSTGGMARAALPQDLAKGALFLRIRSADATEHHVVSTTAAGISVNPTAARAQASLPVLNFKFSGYDDTSYTMTSESMTGVMITMKKPATCELGTTFKWKDYGKPIAEPKNGWLAIKDFTMVRYNNQYLVYMTYTPQGGGFKAAYMAPFADFPQAAAAAQYALPNGLPGVAPEFSYFAPKKQWIFSTQWCSNGSFCYTTGSDPTKPADFAAKSGGQMKPLLTEVITDGKKAPIDHTLICDDTNCYIFYADDNGRIYRGSMPKANFPGEFKGTKKILEDTQTRLFEAVQVYKLKGQKKYLMLVECGWTRYFRAFLADDLGGEFKPVGTTREENTPFAGAKNVTSGWSKDISHGDLVRSSYDEYHEVDPCNLQLIYQGLTTSGDYNSLPYRMGLLTHTK